MIQEGAAAGLMVHWRIPAQVVTARNRYVFTGEEMLIFCLTRLATGWLWMLLSKDVFGRIQGDGVLYSIGLWIFCLLISIIRFLVAQ